MFKKITTFDLATMAIVLDKERKYIQRRTWIRDIMLKRHIEGECVTLYKLTTKISFLNTYVCGNFSLMYFY